MDGLCSWTKRGNLSRWKWMFQFSRMVTLYALTFKCVRVCLCVCLPGMLKNLCLYIVHTCMTLHVLEQLSKKISEWILGSRHQWVCQESKIFPSWVVQAQWYCRGTLKKLCISYSRKGWKSTVSSCKIWVGGIPCSHSTIFHKWKRSPSEYYSSLEGKDALFLVPLIHCSWTTHIPDFKCLEVNLQ